MEFYTLLPTLMSLVTMAVCDGNSNTIQSSGSYTDTLLKGIKRLEDQARQNAMAVGSVVANKVMDECFPSCPIGTICSTDIGVRRCVAAPVVASASFVADYNDPLNTPAALIGSTYGEPSALKVVRSGYNDPAVAAVGLGLGYNDLLLPVARDFDSGFFLSGGASVGGVVGGIGAQLDYNNNGVRLSGCGIVPPECRANQVTPGFLTGAAFKYTYDYTLSRCVRITVCSTCALIAGPQDNLFNTLFSCNRLCRQF